MSSVLETEIVTYPLTDQMRADLPLLADIQFLEPFGSEALNRKFLGIIPKGVYQGFEVSVLSDDKVRVSGSLGNDTALVVRNSNAITVQGQHPVDFTIPTGVQYSIVIEINYTYGVLTKQVDATSALDAAALKLVQTANIEEHHVRICDIYRPAATVLTESMIDYSNRDGGGLFDVFGKAESDLRFLLRNELATNQEVEQQADVSKVVLLNQLWTAFSNLLSSISIETTGVLSGGGTLDDLKAIEIDDASVDKKGAVQLTSNINGTSETLAATQKAINDLLVMINTLSGKVALSEHSHSADDITSGTLAAERLPTASTKAKGAVQTTDTAGSKSSSLVPSMAALNDAMSSVRGQVDYHHSSNSIALTRKSDVTVIDRTVATSSTVSIQGSTFEAGDEIRINCIHPDAGVLTITNTDGQILTEAGVQNSSHTFKGQGYIVLVKTSDDNDNLQVRGVF